MSLHGHVSLALAEKPAPRSLSFGAALVAIAALTPSCAPRVRMCAVDDPCSPGLACVTGRCVPPKGGVRLFEVDDAGAPVVKRRVYAASDVAWVGGASADLPPGALPETVGFGARGGGTLLLRFEGVLPQSRNQRQEIRDTRRRIELKCRRVKEIGLGFGKLIRSGHETKQSR